MEKLIITAAITGGASPEGNPGLPKTPKEQIQAAVDAYNAGASIVHIHARNPETYKAEHRAEFFAEAVAGIKRALPDHYQLYDRRVGQEVRWGLAFQ